jgi:type II secretory pathway predicted ATPase ExeA
VSIIDDAHDVPHQTILGLKRLVEVARENGAVLSVVPWGKPKLRDTRHHPSLEGLGGEAAVFALEGMGSYQREYIEWMITRAANTAVNPALLLSPEALSLLASSPLTPLQIEHYLAQAFEEAYRLGAKPVTADIVAAVFKGRGVTIDVPVGLIRRFG